MKMMLMEGVHVRSGCLIIVFLAWLVFIFIIKLVRRETWMKHLLVHIVFYIM